MKPPEEDIENRFVIWDNLQMLWMDIDIDDEIKFISSACASSNYTIDEIKQIYWNEVLPAVSPNLNQTIPEWKGYRREDLITLVINNHTHGKQVPSVKFNPFYAARNWRKIKQEITAIRGKNNFSE